MKTPEDFAREAVAKSTMTLNVREIAAAIRAYAGQCPVAGSPLSDERLVEIAAATEPDHDWTDRAELLAHIDYLHSIMGDDLCAAALRAERVAGRREGAERQREAIADALADYSYLHGSRMASETPLVFGGEELA